jgi:hypothetical protein
LEVEITRKLNSGGFDRGYRVFTPLFPLAAALQMPKTSTFSGPKREHLQSDYFSRISNILVRKYAKVVC